MNGSDQFSQSRSGISSRLPVFRPGQIPPPINITSPVRNTVPVRRDNQNGSSFRGRTPLNFPGGVIPVRRSLLPILPTPTVQAALRSARPLQVIESTQRTVNPPSIRRPGQTIRRPGQTIVRPRQTPVRPRQTIVRPRQTIVRPRQTIVRPRQTLVRPRQTLRRPGQTTIGRSSIEPPSVRRPEQTLVRPRQTTIGRSSIEPPSVRRPGQTLVRPRQTLVRPRRTTVSPPLSSEKQTVRSPGGNTITVEGEADTNRIQELANMADESGFSDKNIQIVVGSPRRSDQQRSPRKDDEKLEDIIITEPNQSIQDESVVIPDIQETCEICFTGTVSKENLLACCQHPLCDECASRLGKPVCPFCRKPLAGQQITEDTLDKIEKTNAEEIIKTRMKQNFYDEFGRQIGGYAILLGADRGSQNLLNLITYVAALWYVYDIPRSDKERKAIIDDLVDRLQNFNLRGESKESIRVSIEILINRSYESIQQTEAIKQSKEETDSRRFFEGLANRIGIYVGNYSPLEITTLKNKIRTLGREKPFVLFLSSETMESSRNRLIKQITKEIMKLSGFNNQSEESIKNPVAGIIQQELSRL